MTPPEPILDALLELLERVGAGKGAALVSEEELNGWPKEAVRELKAQKLLTKASPAKTVVCPGCERECVMPVNTVSGGTGESASFVVCDKRDDINRVPIPAAQLRQWRCGVEAVARFTASSLGLRSDSPRKAADGLWELGVIKGAKRSQMVCLRANGALELVAANSAIPLVELVRSGAEGYSVDAEVVRRLVDAATTGDARYTPSNARREARKLDTQALYESWRKEYQTLKKRRPEMSDTWYSRQIARTDAGQDRNAETVRKHMKR